LFCQYSNTNNPCSHHTPVAPLITSSKTMTDNDNTNSIINWKW